jgi:TPR repeat protein
MPKTSARVKRYQQAELDDLFRRADAQLEKGEFRSAFRLFLTAAKAGDPACQVNLGNLYLVGTGVRPNVDMAVDWYRRAYRKGYSPAANNIAVALRRQGKLKEALAWFERAITKDDCDANLEAAKIYIEENEPAKAIPYLKRMRGCKPESLTEGSREEGEHLLGQLENV